MPVFNFRVKKRSLIVVVSHIFPNIRVHHNQANQINEKFITELQRYNVSKIMPFEQYACQLMHMKMFDKRIVRYVRPIE